MVERVCVYCKKPIYNSLESVWVCGKNYDIHKKCKQKHQAWIKKHTLQGGENKK